MHIAGVGHDGGDAPHGQSVNCPLSGASSHGEYLRCWQLEQATNKNASPRTAETLRSLHAKASITDLAR